MAASINRFHAEPLGTDTGIDAALSSLAGETTVAAFRITDDQGNSGVVIVNLSGTTIDPDAVATYDQATNSKSLFIDLAGGNIYYKAGATTWTALGS